MTIIQLFDKVATTNEVLIAVEKKFSVMIKFDDITDAQEFETYEELERFLSISFRDWYSKALLNTTFQWTKPINSFYVEAPERPQWKFYTEVTLCEHDL